MLIAALALAGQSLTLDADPYKAALTCAYSVGNSLRPGESRLQAGAESSYFLLQAAAAMPGGATIFEKMIEVTSVNEHRGLLPIEQARQYMPQCEARFPRARSEKPVALPADPFERDVICYYAFALIGGIAEGFGERSGDMRERDRYRALMQRFQRRVDEARPARGFASEAAMLPWGSALLIKSLDQGNSWVFSRACEAIAGQ
jgi:hypothetical protein